MADGTVTGEFRLYTVQARRELERLQREGKSTDQQMERLGKDLDSVGSRKHQTQIRQTSTEVRKLGTTSRTAARGVGSLEQEVSRLAVAIERANFGGRGGGARAARTGGGGGGGSVRGGILGLSGGIKLMAAQATIALPVIRTLAGAVGALGAVAGSAATGGAAVGAAGVVGLATGLGGILSVAKPVSTEIKAIADAQKRYNDAIRQYGKASEQAGTARRELRTARRQGPAGAGALVSEARAFSREWNRATQSSQEGLVKFYREVVATGRKLERPLAGIANQVTNAFSAQGTKAMRFLESRRVRRGAQAGADTFTENLGNVRRVGQATVEMFLNITRASKPFVKEFSDFIAKWFGRQAARTRNIREMRRSIGDMVDDLRSVGRLGGAGVRLLLAILGQGRRPGRGLLDSATEQLREWTRWINRNPAKVQSFFRTAAEDARKLASAVADIVRLLAGLAETLRPILPMISTLASVAGSVGGAGTIGLAGAGLAGFRAARGKPGGPGLIGTMLGRGGRGAGGAAGAAGAAGRMGAGAMAKGALAAAGKAYYPIALGMAGLTAAGTEGGIGRKAQAAGSSLTFGLINAPTSYDELRGRGVDRAGAFAGGIPISAGGNRRLAAESARLGGRLNAQTAPESTATRDIMLDAQGFPTTDRAKAARTVKKGQPVPTGIHAVRGGDRQQLQAQKDALDDELQARRDVVQSLRDEREVRRAPALVKDVKRAFNVRRRAGVPEEEALGAVPGDVMANIRRQKGPRGKKEFAEQSLDWLAQIRTKGPAYEKAYQRLASRIERRWRKHKDHIVVVNGQIFENGKDAFNAMQKAMSSATEKAKQDQMEDLTAIQNQLVRSMTDMGYSKKTATAVIQNQETARQNKRSPGAQTIPTQLGEYAAGQRYEQRYNKARGGRLGGQGLYDTVPMIDGSRAAPGELVVNRHTEAGHDADARSHGLPTLAQRVKRERRPHHAPRTDVYHRGQNKRTGDRTGRTREAQLGAGANTMGASAGLAPYVMLGASYGLSVSSGARPGSITSSGNVSLHSSGNAVDIAGPPAQMLKFAQAMASQYGSGLDELIHTPLGFGIKNGARVAPYAQADHYDHVHVGDRTPGGAAGGIPGGEMLPGGVVPGVKLHAPRRRGRRGALGKLLDRSATVYAGALETKANEFLGAGVVPGGGAVSAGGSFDKGRLANLWTTAGGDPSVANLMGAIALAESGGNPQAHNPSGASGLWQILGNPFPGNPMDPMTNARMAVSKYKSQGLGAWEAYTRGMHTKYMAKGGRVHNAGWFRNGGTFRTNGPTVFGAGEGGTETVSVSKGGGGGRPIMVNITMGTVKVGSVDEAGGVGEQIGRQVASKIAQALREAPAVA